MKTKNFRAIKQKNKIIKMKQKTKEQIQPKNEQLSCDFEKRCKEVKVK